MLKEDGPVFVTLHVEQGPPVKRDYEELYKPERRAALRRELAKGV